MPIGISQPCVVSCPGMHVCVSFKVHQLNAVFAKQCDECATVLPYQEQKQAAPVLCMAENGLQGIHLLLSHAHFL
jgi:hypothetical protein